MSARPVVFISLEPWDEVWRRNQHLLTRLRADGVLGDVLYVEPSVDPLHTALSRRRPRAGRGLRPLADQPGVTLFEPAKLLPRRVDRRQDRRWARSVVAAAGRLRLRDPLLWVNDPRGAELLDVVAWPALHDITDDWLLARRPAGEIARLGRWEEQLLDRCVEVVVCSPALQRSKSGSRPVTLIPNAVDIDRYAVAHRRPEDLPDCPTALYAGTLHGDRLDVGLCCATGELLRNRGATLVLLGPDALAADARTRLDAAGVQRLGAHPATRVPAYLQHADVLVVPHQVTPFTESLDPIKAYEYAAAGRPVVSTAVAGFRDRADVTVVSAPDFPAVVADLVAERRPSVPPVGIPTWQDRAGQLEQVLARIPGVDAAF